MLIRNHREWYQYTKNVTANNILIYRITLKRETCEEKVNVLEYIFFDDGLFF